MKTKIEEPKKDKKPYRTPRITHEDGFARTSLGNCGLNSGVGACALCHQSDNSEFAGPC